MSQESYLSGSNLPCSVNHRPRLSYCEKRALMSLAEEINQVKELTVSSRYSTSGSSV